MNTVKNWSDEWLLRLNIDKCKMVSYYLNNPISTEYHIIHENNTYVLDKPASINDLGVIFDMQTRLMTQSTSHKHRTRDKDCGQHSMPVAEVSQTGDGLSTRCFGPQRARRTLSSESKNVSRGWWAGRWG